MPFNSLLNRINQLPLVLAGPILRRTEPNSVSVWVVLKEERKTVRLRILDLLQQEVLVGESETTALGTNLHIVTVTAKTRGTAAPTSGDALIPGQTYLYNFDFGGGQTLRSPNVIDASGSTVAIAYSQLDLPFPSFVLPPKDLKDLRLLHASCRKPHAEGVDAMAQIDALIQEAVDRTNPTPPSRPHQLFLTGDQIYADDVADLLLYLLDDANAALLGHQEPLPNTSPEFLKPGKRDELARNQCGFTTDEGISKSHLLRLGEFFAMYLFVWSDVLWFQNDADIPSFEMVYNQPASPTKLKSLRNVAGDRASTSIEVSSKALEQYTKEKNQLLTLKSTLSAVRRALANIPTYMILDDHEITDDWFLNLAWCESVLDKPLGQRVLLNGLIAYAIFQAWGNTPEQFVAGQPGARLLQLVSDRILEDKWTETDQEIATCVSLPTLDSIKNHPELPQLSHEPQSLSWHYMLSFPDCDYEVLVLDSRTWRAYPGTAESFPALISEDGFSKQLPVDDATAAKLLLVITATPVLGLPLIEDTQQRETQLENKYKTDTEAWSLERKTFERLIARISTRQGNQQGRAVLLSGDVHYGFATRFQYWAGKVFEQDELSQEAQLVMAQLTSSALRNETREGWWRPSKIKSSTYNLHWAGAVIVPLSRSRSFVAWENQSGNVVGEKVFFPGISADWLIQESPAVEKLSSQVNYTVKNASQPDWMYRIDFIKGDKEAPDPSKIKPVADPSTSDRSALLQQHSMMARNHQSYTRDLGAGRQLVGLNNLGEISFLDDGQLQVRQVLYWWEDARINPATVLPIRTTYQVPLDFENADYPRPEISVE